MFDLSDREERVDKGKIKYIVTYCGNFGMGARSVLRHFRISFSKDRFYPRLYGMLIYG